MYICRDQRERERERERDRETERQRDRETERQRDRDRERERESSHAGFVCFGRLELLRRHALACADDLRTGGGSAMSGAEGISAFAAATLEHHETALKNRLDDAVAAEVS